MPKIVTSSPVVPSFRLGIGDGMTVLESSYSRRGNAKPRTAFTLVLSSAKTE